MTKIRITPRQANLLKNIKIKKENGPPQQPQSQPQPQPQPQKPQPQQQPQQPQPNGLTRNNSSV